MMFEKEVTLSKNYMIEEYLIEKQHFSSV